MATQNAPKAPAADVAATANPTLEDDFASVFAEITSETSNAAAATDAAGAGDAAAAGAGDAASTATDAAGSAGTDAAAADAGDAAAADAAGAAADDDAAKLAAAQARIAELEAAAKKPVADAADDAEPKPAADAADAEADPLAGVQWRKPNEKEGAVLENFRKEWPEVAEAMQMQMQIDVYNAVQYVFAMMKKEYGPRLQRIDQVAEVVGEMATLSDLRTRNNDYDELHDNVVQWADTLTGFQKKAAKQVLENGTPEEVTELFAEYRKANPKAPALVAGTDVAPTNKTQAPKKTELSAAAKKAANALSMVDSKRTSATTTVDPNDFDAGWREATAD
jgi:hypothetical protein